MIFKQVVVCLILAGVAVAGSEPISSGKFRSPLLKRNLDYRVFAPAQASDKSLPMVVYLKGLGIERMGTVSDIELIDGFLKKGMLVVEVDYQSNVKAKGSDMYIDIVYLYRIFGADPARKPVKPRKKVRTSVPLIDGFIKWNPEEIKTYDRFTAHRGGKEVEYRINPKWVYVIPAGYTIDRNVEVSTIKSDKRTIVHRMDVIHPVSPIKPVPAVLEISTFMHPEDPEMHTRIRPKGACYVYAWMMAGYAGVMMDNVVNHVTSEWLYDTQMTCPTGPNFPEKRALRLLRGRKDEFGLSGKVAVMGNSKCNMRAIMSGLINGERPDEKYVVEADKGPYAGESDRFDVMLAGGFPKRPIEFRMILDYLSDDDPALIWCQTVYLGRMKKPDYVQRLLDKQAVLRDIEKRCEAFGVPCRNYFGTPTGHDFDYIYLRDIIAFADKYMK